jgi:zinc/manganese transport system substrate-binding protein
MTIIGIQLEEERQNMKSIIYFSLIFLLVNAGFSQDKINVVTTLSTYADIAEKIGGDKVIVEYIVRGNQDAHFVRPKPSYAVMLNKADLFVTTGLDLEMWVPALVDMSKNNNIRSGQPGYVAAHDGIDLLEKPEVMSREGGDLHIYGNPHITSSPLNMINVAENISIGLGNVDSKNKDYYKSNYNVFKKQMVEWMFGKELVRLMGDKILIKLANSGQLIDFISKKEYKSKKIVEYLGGWMKEGLVLKDKKIVAYHKNWIYFKNLLGIDIVGYVEPKPGIPPSPKHVEQLINTMKNNDIKVIIAANYFDENKVKNISQIVGAKPVIVPLYVYGNDNIDDAFKMYEYWVKELNSAFAESE